jgi:UDP-glucose 4-epimerase
VACGDSPSPAASACTRGWRRSRGANITLPEGRNPDRPPEDNHLDTTRLRADTGFRPEYDVERAVPDYLDWLRGHDH